MKYNKLTIALLMAVSCQDSREQKNELEHIQIISHNDKLRTEARLGYFNWRSAT
ncbi:hypothetical protein P4S68_05240 [Pseudoalteromonas sp. Hal099]